MQWELNCCGIGLGTMEQELGFVCEKPPRSLSVLATSVAPPAASAAMQACDVQLSQSMAHITDAHFDWTDWLLLADRLGLRRTAACCAPPVVKSLLGKLAGLRQPTAHTLFTVLLKAVRGTHPQRAAANITPHLLHPDWRDPSSGMV